LVLTLIYLDCNKEVIGSFGVIAEMLTKTNSLTELSLRIEEEFKNRLL